MCHLEKCLLRNTTRWIGKTKYPKFKNIRRRASFISSNRQITGIFMWKKFQKSILTNAILLNDKLIDILKSHHFKFGISLDGATEKTHEFLRGKHTFERTINNILKLKKNNIHFSITTTIYKENKNTIEDIANLVFNKLGGTILNFNLLTSLGRG